MSRIAAPAYVPAAAELAAVVERHRLGRLAAWRRLAGGIVNPVLLLELEGGPERQVTDWTTMAAHPDWVSDDRLIFNSYDLGFFQDTEEASNLYSVAADGSDLQQLTTFGRSDTRATQPRMTPDGSAIVFTRVDGEGYGRRTGALIDLDGTNLRELTPKEIFATHSQLRPIPPS